MIQHFLRNVVIFLAVAGVVAIAVVGYRVWSDDGRVSYVAASLDSTQELTGVLVLPDDGDEPFLDEINAARESIQLQIYLLSDQETIDALSNAARRGVAVRVMLEEHPYGGAGTEEEVFNELRVAGVDVKWASPEFRFSHIKSMILDDRVLMVMNLNMTESAFDSNREFAVVTTNPEQVNQAMAIFSADWSRGMEPPGGPLVVSPLTSRTDFMQLIGSAEERLDIYAEVITDSRVASAIVAAELRGVRVRLVMSESSDESLSEELPGTLARFGVEVKVLNRIYIHAKALIIDDSLVWIGSQNMTSTSLDDNRELGVRVVDMVGVVRVSRAFEADFTAGEDLDFAA